MNKKKTSNINFPPKKKYIYIPHSCHGVKDKLCRFGLHSFVSIFMLQSISVQKKAYLFKRHRLLTNTMCEYLHCCGKFVLLVRPFARSPSAGSEWWWRLWLALRFVQPQVRSCMRQWTYREREMRMRINVLSHYCIIV